MALFEQDYFTKDSNYKGVKDYRRKKYDILAEELSEILYLNKSNIIIDYGCATGVLVKELKKYCCCYGTDISTWAINYGIANYALEDSLFHYYKSLLSLPVDYVLLLDVLEHCPTEELKDILTLIQHNKTIENIVVRIPVSSIEGNDFVLDISKNDPTHIQCHSKDFWINLFKSYNLKVVKFLSNNQIYDTKGVLACILKKIE